MQRHHPGSHGHGLRQQAPQAFCRQALRARRLRCLRLAATIPVPPAAAYSGSGDLGWPQGVSPRPLGPAWALARPLAGATRDGSPPGPLPCSARGSAASFGPRRRRARCAAMRHADADARCACLPHQPLDLGSTVPADFAQHYVKGKVIGSGSFGVVHLGIDLHTGQEVRVAAAAAAAADLMSFCPMAGASGRASADAATAAARACCMHAPAAPEDPHPATAQVSTSRAALLLHLPLPRLRSR
jgi:hypothetical protein